METTFFKTTIIVTIIIINCQLSIVNCFAQDKELNQKILDPNSGHEIMIGYCELAGITDTVFTSPYKKEYDGYTPDKEVIPQLQSLLDGVTITIVMGTWCSDSREQIPRFMKVIHLADPSFPDPVLICVDRDNKAGEVSLEGMDILKVPTFIIYYNGRELGRIIETPGTIMEKEVLDILKKQM